MRTISMTATLVFCAAALWSGTARAESEARAFANWVDEEHLVVWEHEYAPGDVDIHGRRYSAEGEPMGEAFAIAASGSNETNPTVVYNWVANEYLVVWEHEYSPDDIDLYSRRLSASGEALGSVAVVAASWQSEIEAEVSYSAGRDQYLVTWAVVDSGAEVGQQGRFFGGDGALCGDVENWDEAAEARIQRAWVMVAPVPLPGPDDVDPARPLPIEGSWVSTIPIPIPGPDGEMDSLPVPQPVPAPGAFVSATPITLPGRAVISTMPIPIPNPRSLVSATPITLPDASRLEGIAFVEIEDPEGLLGSLPLPLPGPGSFVAVLPLPLPGPASEDVEVLPLPLP